MPFLSMHFLSMPFSIYAFLSMPFSECSNLVQTFWPIDMPSSDWQGDSTADDIADWLRSKCRRVASSIGNRLGREHVMELTDLAALCLYLLRHGGLSASYRRGFSKNMRAHLESLAAAAPGDIELCITDERGKLSAHATAIPGVIRWALLLNHTSSLPSIGTAPCTCLCPLATNKQPSRRDCSGRTLVTPSCPRRPAPSSSSRPPRHSKSMTRSSGMRSRSFEQNIFRQIGCWLCWYTGVDK